MNVETAIAAIFVCWGVLMATIVWMLSRHAPDVREHHHEER